MTALTKGQRRRRNEKRRLEQDALWLRTVGPLPEHIEAFLADIGPNTDRAARESWQLAPDHVVDSDAFCIDRGKLAQYSARAAICRADDRAETIREMRQEFPGLWGVRGQAKNVAQEWFALTGKTVSVRTVQNYFKASRA